MTPKTVALNEWALRQSRYDSDATAAVVNEMVTERRAMRDRMMKMQDGMMAHMVEHMQAGTASMAMCPLMKPMSDMKH